MVMRVLAIGAHPDDLEIFCYGLLASLKSAGHELILAVATDGAAGVIAGKEEGDALAQIRADETITALSALGRPELLGLADGKLAIQHGAAEAVDTLIRQTQPKLIITHDMSDYHPDHRALSAFVTASAGFGCPVLFSEPLMGVGFLPDYFVDITDHHDAKQTAILAHHSQRPERFAAAAKLMNRYRAAQCNAPEGCYAESYRTDSRFPFADIRAMLPPPPAYRRFYDAGSDGFI